jgi:tRNA-specific 2-thiouridylase
VNPQRVAVAMSGGVDSSVAAALLVEQGYEVIGLMLRLWAGDAATGANRCCSPEDIANAKQVADLLGIPFYVLDAQAAFKEHVVDFFISGYANGITPNPCLECNRQIRWGHLYRHAIALGAEALATGHYARVTEKDGEFRLLRAIDRAKDQSYVLSILGQEHLRHARFPVGEYTKPEVRALAARLSLPTADRPESQDLCFLGDLDYREFLRRHSPGSFAPGPILDPDGARIGSHRGLADYTIGQRKGLGIASPTPLYVLDKRLETNTLVVGPRERLGQDRFEAGPVHWVAGEAPAPQLRASVRVRYKAREVPAEVRVGGGGQVEVRLDEGLPDVTPGQAAVFYDGETCLGGGVILR